MNKKYFSCGLKMLLVTVLLITSSFTTTKAAVFEPKINAQSAIIFDANTGQILAQKNINERLPVASTSKLLTAYLVNKSIKEGKLSWDSKVKITKNISKVSINTQLTNVALDEGKKYTVKQLYEAALIGSANAAAMALGVAVSGSEHAFVELMQQQLKDWGVNDAIVNSAAGLTNEELKDDAFGEDKSTENMWSAKTMAIIVKHLLNEYPNVTNVTSLKEVTFQGRKLESTNLLLPGGMVKSDYHFDGLKTGTSLKAGQNFVGTLTYKGHRLITILFGTGTIDSPKNTRFVETINMLDQTLNNLELKTVQPGALKSTIMVKHDKLKVTNEQKMTFFVPKDKNPTFKIKIKNNLKAPINKNQNVGVFNVNGATYLDNKTTSRAISLQKIEKKSFFAELWQNILDFF